MSDGIPSRSARRRRLGEAGVAVLLLGALALLARPARTPEPTPKLLRQQAQAAAWLTRAKSLGAEVVVALPAEFARQQRASHPYTVYKEVKQIASDIEQLGTLQDRRDSLTEQYHAAGTTERRKREIEKALVRIDNDLNALFERIENL
jgi:hypothetical protein